ncbi:cell envelope integrity protein TolA [Citrobacter portucalensis]|uniref:cell envelope integrity protein TolA n=1 Tax=Citrobacter portucalensis TaxID=1639133 RepID=UPI00226BAC36|nr:cell envelope integrity protein TolA [Citrobacter portucalensis]MCX9019078.1 cell envelope integrity protein TolA [Citrobacter portucalensis]
MKYMALIITALALAGCAHKAPSSPKVSQSTDVAAYAAEFRNAVQAKIYDADMYAGNNCVLQISMQRDGKINDVTAQGGDPALCQAAIKAVQVAEIPAPPTDEIYNKVKNARLDFAL